MTLNHLATAAQELPHDLGARPAFVESGNRTSISRSGGADVNIAFSPATHHWMGATFRIVTGRAESGGAVGVFDSTAPVGFGPPRHIHTAEDEVLMVLTGEIEWVLGDASGRAGPGEALFIPRGTEHAWRVIGTEPCRHIVVVTPGGFEGFFVEMADTGYSIPEDMEAVNESAARHNLVFTGPPLE